MIQRYVRPPKAPRVGVLTSPGRWTDEDGTSHRFGGAAGRSADRTGHEQAQSAPPINLYADRFEAEGWTRHGRGECVCWNHVPIWYHPPKGPKVRLLPDMPATTEARIKGLAAWRDWLAEHEAAGHGPGAATRSLLRATLPNLGTYVNRDGATKSLGLVVGRGNVPDIPYVMGGRVEDVGGEGVYAWASQWDLEAAYATLIGNLRYGGTWTHSDGRIAPHVAGDMVIVRARVRLGHTSPGPLPRRVGGHPTPDERVMFPVDYPTEGQMTGVWALPELEAAEKAGARVKVLESWTHRLGTLVFAGWWSAVKRGRTNLRGYARELAKMTGNQLWSSFCIMPDGERTILSGDEHSRTDFTTSPARDHAMAEWITGSVRARMFAEVLVPYGDQVVCVHTDGAWILGDWHDRPPAPDWRLKDVAAVLQYLGPQMHRHKQPDREAWHYTMSGTPRMNMAETFESAWEVHLWEQSRREPAGMDQREREAILADARRSA